ncbi:MAG: DUF134 domain-containing protein [Candidatus Adiutrix sp.]|jgi:predicted DNA-binding protein (UPF0251 family)|nr:DUF134 domain-containing protein [Candidatus Adiutrix sp.]
MVRPKQQRQISAVPKATYFKPQGIPMTRLSEVRLSVEGLEAVRLADLEGLPCCRAAAHMGISRHTFGRVLAEARGIIAAALVHGQALRIEGGDWVFQEPAARPCEQGLNESPSEMKNEKSRCRSARDREISTDEENLA